MTRYEQVAQELRQRPRKWCVTGIAGFIGSHLAERLLELNQEVIGVDNFITGRRENLPSSDKLQFVEGDIGNPVPLDGVEIVLHQAALGSVPRSIDDPLSSHLANVDGFLKLLVRAKDSGVRRFVYASSSSVYGDSAELPKQEDRIGAPLSPYAATKRIDEIYAEVFSRTYGIECVGLRYFNVFGPRQDPSGPYAAVIPLWIENLLRKEPCVVNGDGTTSRDFCYVENVVQANILAATSEQVSGVYNIACGGRMTLNELYASLAQVTGVTSPPVYRAFRKGDVQHSNADISKAQRELLYSVAVSVEEGLKRTVEGFLKR